MTSRARERGEGNFGCFVWLLILVVIGMVLWKAIPVKIANAELYDYMVEQTKFAGNQTADELKRRILIKAKELDLPITAQQVWIEKTKENIKMRCTYTVPVEFPGYTWEMKVEHDVDRPIFYL